MARFLKYQFESQQAWESVKSTIQEEHNGIISITVGTVVELGHLAITPAVMSEDGRDVITPAVYETAYSVDILWNDDEAEGFEAYRIYCDPSTKAHTFYGLDELYEQEYNNQAS
jgi:hypothetical protein